MAYVDRRLPVASRWTDTFGKNALVTAKSGGIGKPDIAVREALAAEAPELLSGEIEVDESYFDGHRKGKRRRGAVVKPRFSGS